MDSDRGPAPSGQNTVIPVMKPWRMLGWLLLAQVAIAFAGRGLAPLAPLIEVDLDISKAQVGMLPAALFLGQALFNLPAGWLADRFGSRRLLLVLTGWSALSFALAATMSSFFGLLVCVIIGGFAYGAMHPVTNRGILSWFERNRRGTAMGIKQMGITAGSALSALVLLPLALAWEWRGAMVTAAVLVLVVGVAAYTGYRDPGGNEGTLHDGDSLWHRLRQILRNRVLWGLSLASFGLNMGNLVLSTYIVFFAYQALGFPLTLAGLLLVVSETAGSVGRIVWGFISDRWGGRRLAVLLIIAFGTLVCSLLASLWQPGWSFAWLVLLVAVFGFCICGFNGIWMNAATESTPAGQAGLASGFSVSLGSWGVVFGPPLFGAVVDITGGYTVAWLLLAGVMVGVIVLLLAVMRIRTG